MGIETLAIAGLVGSVGSAAIGSSAAGKAAKAQQQAASDANALAQYQYDTTRSDYLPFLNTGYKAAAALAYENGLADRPTADGRVSVETIPGYGPTTTYERKRVEASNGRGLVWQDVPTTTNGQADTYSVGGQTFDNITDAQAYADQINQGKFDYQGYEATPGYQYALDQSSQAIERAAAARGRTYSGATQEALQANATGLAQQDYTNFLNRLSGLAGTGQSATSALASYGAQNAATQGSNLLYAGNARASAYQTQGNLWNSALGQGVGALGLYSGGNSLAGGVGSGATSYSGLGFSPISASPSVLSF